MKKPLLLTLSLLALVPSVPALDWGVNVNEAAIGTLGQANLFLENVKAKAWLAQPIFGADFRLEGEASYSNAFSAGAWAPGTVTFDLAEASLRGTTPLENGVTEWEAGRRQVTDSTGGWIISSRWDGAAWSWLQNRTRFAVSTGYSGFLLKKGSKVSGSAPDDADLANTAVVFAPQRIYGMLGFSLNEAVLRQDLQLELLGDYDFRSADSVHGAYATVAVNGPLPLGWRQRLFGTASYRIASDKTWGYVAGAEWSATLPFMGSRLVISAVGAQGFEGHGFRSLSGKGLAEVVDLPTFHGGSAGFDFSLKPLAKTTVGLKSTALFRTSLDQVGLEGFDKDSQAYWLGTEFGVYGSWTPTSDLALAATGGVFLPQSSAFTTDTKLTAMAVVTATLKL